MSTIAFNWQAGESDDPSPQHEFTPPLRRKQVPAVAFSMKDSGQDAGEIAPTLRAMEHSGSNANGGGQVAVAFDTTQITSAANRSSPKPGDPCHPLAAHAHAHAPALAAAMSVRRLTPRECERLQGFPDDYTAIPYRGKPAADGPRYRALGNSMAVPVMRWIGQGIERVANGSNPSRT